MCWSLILTSKPRFACDETVRGNSRIMPLRHRDTRAVTLFSRHDCFGARQYERSIDADRRGGAMNPHAKSRNGDPTTAIDIWVS